MFRVVLKKSVKKSLEKMPDKEIDLFTQLANEIRFNGPIRTNWKNYGILTGTNTHHCHLSRKWVACWVETEKGIEVEVTYVGSRESAPYAK